VSFYFNLFIDSAPCRSVLTLPFRIARLSTYSTYDPLKYRNVNKDSRVGVIGIGGLGTIGIKLAKALGATVTASVRIPRRITPSQLVRTIMLP